MTTTTTARPPLALPDEFLAAVLADPFDDGPRLVAADYLEERGCPRGEFVRVQCELAADEWPCNCTCEYEHGIGCPAGRAEYLRRRERELLEAHGAAWAAPVAAAFGLTRSGVDHGHSGGKGGVRWSWDRGFVGCVTVPSVAVLFGGPCGACWVGEDDHRHRVVHDCRFCHGTGRTPGCAAALFGAAPIKGVAVADREPYQGASGWFWYDVDATLRGSLGSGHPASNLPSALFAALKGGKTLADYGRYYPTRPAALEALSRAAVDLGRSLTGAACGRCNGGGTLCKCRGCGTLFRHVHRYSDCGNAACEGERSDDVPCPGCDGRGTVRKPGLPAIVWPATEEESR